MAKVARCGTNGKAEKESARKGIRPTGRNLAERRAEIGREQERGRLELEYLRALLAHPAAGRYLSDIFSHTGLLWQAIGGDDAENADWLVAALVIAEAMKALREKAGVGDD